MQIHLMKAFLLTKGLLHTSPSSKHALLRLEAQILQYKIILSVKTDYKIKLLPKPLILGLMIQKNLILKPSTI